MEKLFIIKKEKKINKKSIKKNLLASTKNLK